MAARGCSSIDKQDQVSASTSVSVNPDKPVEGVCDDVMAYG